MLSRDVTMDKLSHYAVSPVTGKRLTVLAEDAELTVAYLKSKGVHPHQLITKLNCFKRVLKSLGSDDDLLIIVHGLTSFKLSVLYNFLSEFKTETCGVRLICLSDILFDNFPISYYLYSGDLFLSSITEVRKKNKKIAYKKEEGVINNLMQYYRKGYEIDYPVLCFGESENWYWFK